jgi:putative DNA primase/helicase
MMIRRDCSECGQYEAYPGDVLCFECRTKSMPVITQPKESAPNGYAEARHLAPVPDTPDELMARAEAEARHLEHLTDLGNARRLVRRNGEDLRFCPPLRKWFAWDGMRWRPDATREVHRRAKDTVLAMYEEAATTSDSTARRELAKWAAASESDHRIRAMIELASTEAEVVVDVTSLDADPELLNVRNGTLDLRAGKLRPHERGDLLTKLAPIEFAEGAQSDIWEDFLTRVLPTPDDRDFLARAAGYTLSGLPLEEVLFFLFGPTASGKSTFIEAIKATLGDYAMTADFSTFLRSRPRDGSAARGDVARLTGARFVGSVEVQDGQSLAEGTVKWLTGGDTVTARRLYSEEFEFAPQFTLWLAANDRPRARDDDDALWRRILTVPFIESIPEEERDESLKQRLRTPSLSGPAILSWMVDGLRDYRDRGLDPPASVRVATQAYRDAMDPLTGFLDECCELDRDHSELFKSIWKAYSSWAEDNVKERRSHLTKQELGSRLTSRGFETDGKRQPSRWGLRLGQDGQA